MMGVVWMVSVEHIYRVDVSTYWVSGSLSRGMGTNCSLTSSSTANSINRRSSD